MYLIFYGFCRSINGKLLINGGNPKGLPFVIDSPAFTHEYKQQK